MTEEGFVDELVPTAMVSDNLTANSSTANQYGANQMYQISLVLTPVTFLAIIANTLTAISIIGATKPLSPHLRFLLSLALSDLVVSVGVAVRIDQVLRSNINQCQSVIGDTLYATGLLANLGNLASIAVDHDLAISRPLQHHLVMTSRRANIAIMAIWLVAIAIVGVRFLAPLWELNTQEMSVVSMCNYLLVDSPFHTTQVWIILIITLLCGITLMGSYVRLVLKLRAWGAVSITKNQSAASPRRVCSQTLSADMSKPTKSVSVKKSPKHQTRKALVTTVLLIGTFLLCWLPSGLCLTAYDILKAMDVAPGHRHNLAVTIRFVWSLVIANTLTDPIIYAARIPEVKRGFRAVFGPVLCCCPSSQHRYEFTQNTLLKEQHYGSTVVTANGHDDQHNPLTDLIITDRRGEPR